MPVWSSCVHSIPIQLQSLLCSEQAGSEQAGSEQAGSEQAGSEQASKSYAACMVQSSWHTAR